MAFQVNRSLRRRCPSRPSRRRPERGDCVDQCRSRGAPSSPPPRPLGPCGGSPVVRAFEWLDGDCAATNRWCAGGVANLVLEAAATPIRSRSQGSRACSLDVLDQGTATRNALQLAEEVAQIGASLDTPILHAMRPRCRRAASAGIFLRRLRSSPSRFAEVFLLRKSSAFARPASRVSFSNGESSSDRRQRHGQDAVWHASIRIQRAGTTVESNKQLTREDLQAFWRQHFVPGNAALVVTGAITVAELRKLAETTFGSGVAAPPRPPSWGALGRAAALAHRRSSRVSADAAARSDVRRAAQQPGLRARARDEYDSRRHVREPHQHESARAARLHLRRKFAVCVLAQRWSVCGGHWCSHRRDRAGGARSDARAQEG